MKKILIVLSATCVLMGTAVAQDVTIKKGKVTMSEAQYNEMKAKAEAYDRMTAAPANFNDSASYAIGRDIFSNWEQQQLGINARVAGLAMQECAAAKSRLNDQQAMPLLQRFQQEFELRKNAGARENIEKGEKFMKEVSNNKSVYTTKSGLKYLRVREGNGKHPTATDRVKVHYTGKLIDGKVFDSSVERGSPITFPLNQVIPGWTEGLQLMDEGSKYILYIPYNLGYGTRDMGDIPAGSTLIFEVELLKINPED